MCGRFNVGEDPYARAVLVSLEVDLGDVPLRTSDFVRPGDTISIVRESDGKRVLRDAVWWLVLKPTGAGFKPSPNYFSINTRYDRLNDSRSSGYKAFRESRCIVIASGFGETEFETVNGKKKPKFYHDFRALDSAIAFGGLCREYANKNTGEIVTSCSIITLPPHEKLIPYHSTASPMMLPQEGPWIEMWLDSEFHEVEQFQPLLEPAIRHNLRVQQIDKPGKRNPIGESFVIPKDA